MKEERTGPIQDVLFASSEISPYAKTGGLGDVMAALPAEMRRAGHRVAVVIPGYRVLWSTLPGIESTGLRMEISLGEQRHQAEIFTARTAEGVVLWIVGNPDFFDREGLYGDPGDYEDNARRFIFFSKAVVKLVAHVNPLPKVLHLNDWQTALAAVFAKSEGLPVRTVLTVHNLAYQGRYPEEEFRWMNLPASYFSPAACEFYGHFNFLKSGLLLADELTTVSPGYAEEITTPAFGCGLDGLLNGRRAELTGITNGIDVRRWNPEEDPHLPVRYGEGQFARKEYCKFELLRERRLSPDLTRPLYGCVSRLADQKGFDLILEILPRLLHRGGRAVVLGSGDPGLEAGLEALQARFPNQMSVEVGFDEALAHRIEAGADFFLMPSRFEPCGLNQMYSQRYGTVPIVHGVGGLKDTVEAWQMQTNGFFRGTGSGFVFNRFDADEFMQTINEAEALRRSRPFWNQIRINGMKRDFSWGRALKDYERLYTRLTEKR